MRVSAAGVEQLLRVLLQEGDVVRTADCEEYYFTGEPSNGTFLHVLLVLITAVLSQSNQGIQVVPHGHHRHHGLATLGGESHPEEAGDCIVNLLGLHIYPDIVGTPHVPGDDVQILDGHHMISQVATQHIV